jgi:hypothetical protein
MDIKLTKPVESVEIKTSCAEMFPEVIVPEESVEARSDNEENSKALLLAITASDVDKVDKPTCVAKTPDESVLKDDNVILEKEPNVVDKDDTEICKADMLNVVDDIDDKRFVFWLDRLEPVTVEKVERPT